MSETKAETTKPPWVNHFFAVLPDATGARLLMLPSADGWKLPYVRTEEEMWLSDAPRISGVLSRVLGLDFVFTVLRYVALEENESERWTRTLFVLEPAQPLLDPPLGGQWVDRQSLQEIALAQPDQREPLLHYLEENEQGPGSPLIDPRRSPWARTGWFAAASAWIEEAIVELGYTQTGPVEQLRNWSLSCLLTVPTSAGKLYFKAAAALPLFVNEPALTQTLAGFYPGHVPKPLKIERDKRWLLMEEFGPNMRAKPDYNFETTVPPIMVAFSKLQRDSAHHLRELAAAGCIDRRLPTLVEQIDPLLADPITRSVLEPQEYEELLALGPPLKKLCARAAEYNLPPALIHGDLHMGNVTERNGDYLFFDWTDAAISVPFFDHFLIYFPSKDAPDRSAWRDAYLAAWQEFETPERLLELWEIARPLCALHHSVSYLSIVNNVEPLVRHELLHGLPDNLHNLLATMKKSS
jgi:hypothetical protein